MLDPLALALARDRLTGIAAFEAPRRSVRLPALRWRPRRDVASASPAGAFAEQC